MKLINTSRNVLCKIEYFILVFVFSASFLTGCLDSPEETSNDSSVTIIPDNNSFLELNFSVKNYEIKTVEEHGKTYSDVVFNDGVRLNKKGFASLPFLHASVQIPATGEVNYEIIQEEYLDIPLDHPFLPSKGTIYRNQDPDDIIRTIDPESYSIDMYPENIVRMTDPYIFRDVRGVNVYVHPFRYDALNNTLRVYNKLRISLEYQKETISRNVMAKLPTSIAREMVPIYKSVFINYGPSNTDKNIRLSFSHEIAESGDILVIYTSRDASAISPYITWKRQMGYRVYTQQVSTGTNVKSIIQSAYSSNNNLLYVQLVGDWADIKSDMGTSQYKPMDPMLGCVAGSDYYPDLIIGRFSAGSSTHVTTQVNKTINYEKNPDTSGTWYSRALGLGSSEGPGDDGERDYQHIDNIQTYKLKANTYTASYRYTDGDYSSSTSNAVNNGVSVINYTGHGLHTEWNTTSFNTSDVNYLNNGERLPFIFSVACLVGGFHLSSDSFAEVWLRKANGGAVAALMSTISQPWYPPMRGQDYMNDLLTGGYNYSSNPGSGISTSEGRTTFGSITFNGLVLMYSESSGTDDRDTMQSWTIFGDAALQVRTAQPRVIAISSQSVAAGQSFSARVTSGSSGVPGARVTLSQGTSVYSAYTNSTGYVTLSHGLSTGSAKLVVSGFNLDTLAYDVTVGGTNEPTPPNASFSYSISNLKVQFSDTSTDDGSIVARSWNFGDGQTSTLSNPIHTYAEEGTYTVVLTVKDQDGLADSISKSVTVTSIVGPDETVEEFNNISVAPKEEDNYSFVVKPGTDFRAVMTGTNDADLYVRYGAAPTTTTYDCRPYLSGTDESCEGTVPANVNKAYVMVVGYEASNYSLTVTYTKGEDNPDDPDDPDDPSDGEGFLEYNSQSLGQGEFRYYQPVPVEPDTELNVSITGTGDADLYVRFDAAPTTSTYDARPYVEGSNEDVSIQIPAGVSKAYVMVHGYKASSYDVTISYFHDEALDLVNSFVSQSVAKGVNNYYGPFDIIAGGSYSAVMSGSGDADLFTRYNAMPDSSNYTCRPYTGTSNEECEASAVPAGSEKLYIMVNGYEASGFTLTVTVGN